MSKFEYMNRNWHDLSIDYSSLLNILTSNGCSASYATMKIRNLTLECMTKPNIKLEMTYKNLLFRAEWDSWERHIQFWHYKEFSQEERMRNFRGDMQN